MPSPPPHPPADRLLLFPGSAWATRDRWQVLAHTLPSATALLILPAPGTAPRRALECLAPLLHTAGYQVVTIPDLPAPLTLVSCDSQKHRYRAYTLALQETLFGELTLVCRWGRIGTARRRQRSYAGSVPALTARFQATLHRRLRHGYQPVQRGALPVRGRSWETGRTIGVGVG